MLLWDFLAAFIVAAVLAVMVSLVAGRRNGWAGFFSAFMILLLATWAGGVWIAPFEARPRGFSVFVFLVVGLVCSFILGAAATAMPSSGDQAAASRNKILAMEFGLFFWLAMVVLGLAIAARYLWHA